MTTGCMYIYIYIFVSRGLKQMAVFGRLGSLKKICPI